MTETLRVLLVEDDKVDQMAFARFVQKQNLAYDYEIAGSFAEAASVVKTRHFDIVISDYLIGDGTAFDVLDLAGEWPVIVTTGSGDEEIAVRAMKQGAYDYLIKDPEGNYLKMLPVTIANAVRHRRNEVELQRYHDELEQLVREKTEVLRTEIEERKKAEEALKLDEERLESLLQLSQKRDMSPEELVSYALEEAVRLTQSGVGYLHFYEEGVQRISFNIWSSQVLKLCTAEKIPHYPLEQAGIWADSIRLRKAVIHNDYQNTPERKGMPAGHFPLHRHMSVPIFHNGEVVGVVGVGNKEKPYDQADVRQLTLFMSGMWDLVQSRKTAEKLRASEERFRLAFDNANSGMCLLGLDGRFLQVNNALAVMLGRARQELESMSVMEVIHDADQPTSREFLDSLVSSVRDSAIFTNRYLHLDGHIVWGSVAAALARAADGQPLYFVLQIQDITEQKKIAEAKKALEERLLHSQKMEAIGTLAGGIAHDFNNILVPILSFTELVMETMPRDSESYHDLQEVLRAGNRAKDLVKQILTFSRRKNQEKKSLLPMPIIKESVKLLQASLPSNIEIRLNLTAGGSTILADPTQLQQIVMNLCTNAYHAMQEKGGVLEIGLEEVEVRADEPVAAAAGQVDVKPGCYLRLAVQDSGAGMDKEIMDRIFDPYFTTKGVGKGTGLGLSVVHGIVQSYGGAITVHSSPGAGTGFHVYLPVHGNIATDRAEVWDEMPPGGTERVLLVDDERTTILPIQMMLKTLGYQVTAETNSMEALDIFARAPGSFDLVITDQTMPGLTGDRLVQKLRALRPDIPIILCSGYSSEIDEDRARDLAIQKFLFKPILFKELAAAVREALGSRK